MSTIAAGQLVGMSRAAALEFSFFLSIPTMTVATLYTLFKSLSGKDENPIGVAQITSHEWVILAIGFVVSFIVAYGAVAWFMGWVRKRGFAPFAMYRIVLGIAVLAWAAGIDRTLISHGNCDGTRVPPSLPIPHFTRYNYAEEDFHTHDLFHSTPAPQDNGVIHEQSDSARFFRPEPSPSAPSITALAATADFGPSNPFYAPSTLPFQAPPFDKIKDEDYQPAIEAGMAQQQAEIQAIADNPAAPTFDNTIVAMEKSGRCSTASWRLSMESRAQTPTPLFRRSRPSRPPNSPRTRTSSTSTRNSSRA